MAFQDTQMGRRFFERTLPRLAEALEGIAVELQRANDLKERERCKCEPSNPDDKNRHCLDCGGRLL